MSSYKRIPKSLVKKSDEPITITEDYTGGASGYYGHYEKNELQKVKEKVDATAQEMMEQVEQNRSSLVEKAYQEGFEKAKKEVEAEIYLQHEAMLKEANHFYEKANEYHQQLLQEAQLLKKKYIQEEFEQLLTLIVACSEKIIRQEIEKNPEKLSTLFEQILSEITYENKKIFLRVHPKTREMLKAQPQLWEQSYLELLPDGTLQPGDLVVETEREYLDATIQTQIEGLKQVLRSVLGDSIKSYE